MATGAILLPAGAWKAADASASNAAPAAVVTAGTQSAPKGDYREWAFDASTIEYLHWTGRVPVNYASGGVLKILWRSAATTGNVIWAARVACVTPADTDTPLEHAYSTAATVTTSVNTTEASRLVESSITLNMDSAAAGDEMSFIFYRNASDGSDTAAGDAFMRSVDFQYTTT